MIENYAIFREEGISWDHFPNAKEVNNVGKPSILISFIYEYNGEKNGWHYFSIKPRKDALKEALDFFPFKRGLLDVSVIKYGI